MKLGGFFVLGFLLAVCPFFFGGGALEVSEPNVCTFRLKEREMGMSKFFIVE